MDKSKRESNEVSKNDVEAAMMILVGGTAFIIFTFMCWLVHMSINEPEKLQMFTDRIDNILNPITPVIETFFLFALITAISIVLAAMSCSALIVWKGRHHLSDVLEVDDK